MKALPASTILFASDPWLIGDRCDVFQVLKLSRESFTYVMYFKAKRKFFGCLLATHNVAQGVLAYVPSNLKQHLLKGLPLSNKEEMVVRAFFLICNPCFAPTRIL